MQQPGRTSSAELSVVRVSASDRPRPPERLTEDQARLWESITATKPADWFTDDTLPLLEAYCEGWLTHRMASGLMREFTPDDLRVPEKLKDYASLEKIQRGAASSLAGLAQKMRLAQSARYGARGASGAHERTLKASKPWET